MMVSPQLSDKAGHFELLSQYLKEDSDSDDEVLKTEVARRVELRALLSRRVSSPQPLQRQVDTTELNTPRRTASAPTPVGDRIIEGTPASNVLTRSNGLTTVAETSFIAETPIIGSSRAPSKMPSRSATHPPSKSLLNPKALQGPRNGNKRKRGSTEVGVPEHLRLLKGLSFFYIPNDDVSSLRRARIRKAQDYGAAWVRSIDQATHVIVDKALRWEHIEGEILKAKQPERLIVVNENFPLDSVSSGALCKPNLFKYKIRGCPFTGVTPPPPLPAQENNETVPSSLQINAPPQNNPKKWDYVPRPLTPARNPPYFEDSGSDTPEKVVPNSPPRGPAIASTSQGIVPSSQPTEHETERPASLGLASHHDVLSRCIDMIRESEHLPLNDDGTIAMLVSEDSASVESDGNETEAERSQKRSRKSKTTTERRNDIKWEQNFACHRGGILDEDKIGGNPNARTIEILQSMADHYTRVNDHWRPLAYRKAITALKRATTRVTTEEEALRIPGVGKRLAEKIQEIVETDRLRRLEYAQSEPTDKILTIFLGIYGVGTSQANKWIAQGFTSIEDLKERAQLTRNQRIGIEYYDDLNTCIPRHEVEALGAYVKGAALEIDPQVELVIGGSYRRGAKSSNDIDFIVTKKGTKTVSDLVAFLEELVQRLTAKGFLTVTLAALRAERSGKQGPGSKWHGCCVLPRIPGGINDNENYRPIWRRIDFLLVPETEYGAALIYFTGNDIFNRSIRLLASKKGMTLNQRGLYRDVTRGQGKTMMAGGELVEGRDEKAIFKILGVPYFPPEERNC
jgi:DNA polymerase IV